MSSADSPRHGWYPVRTPAAFWARVGAADDEVVVMLEDASADNAPGGEARAFLVRGTLAVAWWSRMDGARGHDVRSLIVRAAEACGLSEGDCGLLFDRFCAQLVESGLVARSDEATDVEPGSPEHAVTPYPKIRPQEAATEFCSPLHLDSFVQQDLVALGTFFGGTDNVSATWPCSGQTGGEGNTVSTTACRPGQGYGLFNGGWTAPACGG